MTSVGVLLLSVLVGASGISGHVVDAQGAPLAGARVFLENGIASDLIETRSEGDGSWKFAGPVVSGAGVFAVADGLGFGGATLNSAVSDVTIRLVPAATLTGTVVNQKDKPVAGAHVTRVGLLGDSKVGIPLGKLAVLGIAEPVTDEQGRFTVPNLPQGGTVALKVGHPDYAQEAVDNLSVASDARVMLYNGLPVRGQVLSRGTRQPVAGVSVMVRNAQPPHDTAMCASDHMGKFSLWLKPGVYMYQAISLGLRSPGWNHLVLDGKKLPGDLEVFVSGKGRIVGKVCDAVSGNGVADTKVTLETQGNMAAVVRTGSDGTFATEVMAGPNSIRIEPAPGYLAPEQPALQIEVVEGQETAVPSFWLAPIPSYAVHVIDDDDAPAAEAVISVLQPQQFGWRKTDESGSVKLTFGSVESSVIGLAEDMTQPKGALFALKRDDASGATVKLFELGSVQGRVVDALGEPMDGAIVAGTPENSEMPLWRTLTGPDGSFEWHSVAADVPTKCIVYGPNSSSTESPAFTVSPGGSKDVGTLGFAVANSGKSLKGNVVEWHKGGAKRSKEASSRRTVVMYSSASDAPMVVESAAHAQSLFGADVVFAVVVDGGYSGSAAVPVFSGTAPGTATTLVLDSEGKVLLETFGMPPLRALQ